MAKTQPVLTRAELEALRKRLQEERHRIVSVLNEPLSSMPAGEPQELEEAAQRATEQDRALAVDAPERALLKEIDVALAKLDAGTYGVSEKTGQPIPYERLIAVPWARQGVDE